MLYCNPNGWDHHFIPDTSLSNNTLNQQSLENLKNIYKAVHIHTWTVFNFILQSYALHTWGQSAFLKFLFHLDWYPTAEIIKRVCLKNMSVERNANGPLIWIHIILTTEPVKLISLWDIAILHEEQQCLSHIAAKAPRKIVIKEEKPV